MLLIYMITDYVVDFIISFILGSLQTGGFHKNHIVVVAVE